MCFILGQLQEYARTPSIQEILKDVIEDKQEKSIVRHEAVISYAALFGKDEVIVSMEKDDVPIVRESALVCQ